MRASTHKLWGTRLSPWKSLPGRVHVEKADDSVTFLHALLFGLKMRQVLYDPPGGDASPACPGPCLLLLTSPGLHSRLSSRTWQRPWSSQDLV